MPGPGLRLAVARSTTKPATLERQPPETLAIAKVPVVRCSRQEINARIRALIIPLRATSKKPRRMPGLYL